MQGPLWLSAISKTDFLGVFSLFPIYTWKGLCHLYIIYYERILYSCDNVSWSLPLLFLSILYLGLLMLKQCICKLYLEIDIDCLGGILIWFYSCMALYLEHYFSLISCCVNWCWRHFLYRSSLCSLFSFGKWWSSKFRKRFVTGYMVD